MARPAAVAGVASADGELIVAHAALRGIAAVCVVGYHTTLGFFRHDAPFALSALNHGYLFVDLFFMLSGFILWARYAAWFRSGLDAPLAARFLTLRLARIYPNYCLWLAVYISLFFATGAVFGWNSGSPSSEEIGRSIGLHLVMLQSILDIDPKFNIPFWSIAVEMLCYAVLPALAALAAFMNRGALVVSSLAFSVLIYGYLISEGTIDVVVGSGSILRGLAGFAIGIAIASGVDRIDRLKTPLVSALQIAGLAGSVVAVQLGAEVWALSAFALTVAVTARNRGIAARLFDIRLLRVAGDASYTVYLCHLAVLAPIYHVWWQVEKLVGSQPVAGAIVVFLAGSTLSLWIGANCYRFFEVPAQRIVRARLRARRSGPGLVRD